MTGYNVNELWEFPSGKVLGPSGTSLPPVHDGRLPTQSSALPHVHNADIPSSKFIQEEKAILASACSPFQHPSNPDWFVIVTGDSFHVFTWANFEQLTPPGGVLLERASMSTDLRSSPTSKFASKSYNFWHPFDKATFHIGPGFVVELARPSPSTEPRLYVWPADSFDPYKGSIPVRSTSSPMLESFGQDILAVLGFTGTSMVYLDTKLWICSTIFQPTPGDKTSSVEITRRLLSENVPRRHFFALSEWRTASGELKCAMIPSQVTSRQSRSREFVFVSGHRLVAVKGGFEI
ncbi:hypothetical protein N7493_001501 [Penicillium malachiteum]|uniref:Uncharacterized protein n=1 Tax=Penicillium malachiteum TaxID=1324776 RepID=A0AAD6N0E1_9EURO|nr:hypothetical protein N7493_001501 [Penicillium malachiteum]